MPKSSAPDRFCIQDEGHPSWAEDPRELDSYQGRILKDAEGLRGQCRDRAQRRGSTRELQGGVELVSGSVNMAGLHWRGGLGGEQGAACPLRPTTGVPVHPGPESGHQAPAGC